MVAPVLRRRDHISLHYVGVDDQVTPPQIHGGLHLFQKTPDAMLSAINKFLRH
jgi:hypothetical protein